MAKKNKNEREMWQQDVVARQRNIVFPATAFNEGRFWRNLSTTKWGFVQVVGVILMILTLAAALYSTISIHLLVFEISGTLWERIWGDFGWWIISAGILAILLLLGQVVSRHSTSSSPMDRHRRR